MVRLVSRERQIPNGFRFLQPETNWQPPKFASFETIVQSLITHRKANPFLVQKNGWPTDPETVRLEVDYYNARLCQQLGWRDFIITDEGVAPPPKLTHPPSSQHVAGAGLLSWLWAGGTPVAIAAAEERAATCVACPLNKKGDWTQWFTIKASELIRKALERRTSLNISTTQDDKLGICEACTCPLKLKVHTPLDHIVQHMPAEERAKLDKNCWILK